MFVVWLTLLKREPSINRTFKPELFWAFRIWIAGQHNGKAETIQYIENVLFFIPFGFLFPWKEKWKHTFIGVLVSSVLIEVTQYIFVLDWCEIDDVISNVIGALLGYWAFFVIKKRYRLQRG